MRSVLALALLAPVLAAACGSSQPDVAEPTTRPEAAPAEPVGAATITAAELRAHVTLLASDDYQGRETMTEGAARAADYLSRQFRSYGLAPLPGHESYEVAYTLEQIQFSPERNRLALVSGGKRVKAALGSDFTPFNFTDSGSIEGAPVVFAGYGISAPEHGWDDYRGLDVSGKVVVVLRHWPHEKAEGDDRGPNPAAKRHGAEGSAAYHAANPLAGGNYGLFTTKAKNAAAHGAAAMLLVTDPLNHEAAGDDLDAPRFLRLPMTDEEKARAAELRRVRERRAAAKGHDEKGEGAGPLLALHISQGLAARLVPDLAGVQKKLDAGAIEPGSVTIATRIDLTIEQSKEPVAVHPDNVIGYLEGSDPRLKDELVVVGGHYDHLGESHGEAGPGGDHIYNGADDNASGTAAVLELAQAFASLPEHPARSMVFIGFSGEEEGLLGSTAMLRQGQLPTGKIRFMLNLDMIGRNPKKPMEVLGAAYDSGMGEVVERANQRIGLELEDGGTNYEGNSDHHPFYKRDIPMMFFFTGLHPDYHGLGDHADKLDYERMEKIVKLGYGVLEPVASGAVSPTFIYNLLWLGARVEIRGGHPVFTEVAEGSRAARAGLEVGDAVVGVAGEALAQPRDFGERLRSVEPGTRLALEIERGGARKSVEVMRAKPGFLGVFPGPVPEKQRTAHGLAADEGVLIRKLVSGGPAAKSGIEEGDILVRIAGEKVGIRSLGRRLSTIGAGEKVHIVVIRGGERKELTMVLGERK